MASPRCPVVSLDHHLAHGHLRRAVPYLTRPGLRYVHLPQARVQRFGHCFGFDGSLLRSAGRRVTVSMIVARDEGRAARSDGLRQTRHELIERHIGMNVLADDQVVLLRRLPDGQVGNDSGNAPRDIGASVRRECFCMTHGCR